MAGGVIVQRKAGATVPEGYLERILNLKPKRFGIASIDKQTGIKVEKFSSVPDLKDFVQALEVDKREAYIWFSLYPSTFDEHDVQPFLLLGEEEDPQLCVIMEGDYVASTTDSSHLDVWHAKEEMIEEIGELYDLCGNDLDKLLIALRGKAQFRNFTNKIKSNGSMLFLPADGDTWVVDKESKFSRSFDWGWTSNVCGWNPNKVVEKDNASERKPAAKSFADAFAGKAPITPQPDTVVPPTKEPLHLPETNPDDPEPPLVQASNSVKSSKLKAIKKWAEHISWDGKLPPELQMTGDGTPITEVGQIDWKRVRLVTKDWKAWEKREKARAEAANHPKPVEVKTDTEGRPLTAKERVERRKALEAAAEHKTTDTVVEESIAPPKETPVNKHSDGLREFVPISTPEDRSAIETMLLEVMSGERKITPPKELKEMAAMTFSKRYGVPDALSVGFEPGDLWTLCHKHPADAYLLLKEAMAELERLTPAKSADKKVA